MVLIFSRDGGIGRHEGLKIPWAEGPVRVRLPFSVQSIWLMIKGFIRWHTANYFNILLAWIILSPTNIGAWCNGSTDHFGWYRPDSNSGAPTIIKTIVMIWYIILVIFIIYLLVVSGIMFFFATKFRLVNTIVQWEKEDTFYIFCPIIHLFTLYYFWTLK